MQAFIFDFDGVVVDSERHWPPILTGLLAGSIQGFTEEEEKKLKGFNMHKTYEVLRDRFGLQWTEEEYVRRVEEAVNVVYTDLCVLLPGITELLESLKNANMPIAIASSSQRRWIDTGITRLGIKDYFQAIATADETPGRAKPFPDLYLLAAKKLGVDPSECVAIEDSCNGAIAAKDAGMYCIGLRTYMSEGQDLSRADIVIEDMRTLDAGKIAEMSAK